MKTKILYLLLIFSLVSKAQNDDNNIETFREFYIGSNLSFESSSLNGNIIEEFFSGYIDNILFFFFNIKSHKRLNLFNYFGINIGVI